MKRTKDIIRFLSLLAPCLFCACTTAPQKQVDSINMAAILPLSGSRAEEGHMLRRGIEIAVAQINKRADKESLPRVKLTYADTGSSNENIRDIVRAVQDSGAEVIHAGLSDDIAFGIEELGKRQDILVNFLCEYPPAAVQVKNALRIYSNGAQICEKMAEVASVKAEKFGDKKILIASVDNIAGTSCGNYLKFQTGSSNFKMFAEKFREGESDFEIFAAQIKNIKPDYILVYSKGKSAEHFLQALEKAGYEGIFATNETFAEQNLKSSKEIKVFQVESAFSRNDVKCPKAKNFAGEFEEKFKAKPNFAAAFAYDAVWATYEAMLKANRDAKLARKSLLGKSLDGASGKIQIDKLGDSTSELSLSRK